MFYKYLVMSMDIYAIPGKKVVYNLPNNGRAEDKEMAADYLSVNRVYTIKEMVLGDNISYVKLKEVPGMQFNSVLFSNYIKP